MSIEERPDHDLPELHLSKEGPRCGKFVGKDGDRDLYCDLQEGHAEPACSARVEGVDL
jgi:hypothetical protein